MAKGGFPFGKAKTKGAMKEGSKAEEALDKRQGVAPPFMKKGGKVKK